MKKKHKKYIEYLNLKINEYPKSISFLEGNIGCINSPKWLSNRILDRKDYFSISQNTKDVRKQNIAPLIALTVAIIQS